jgi:TonB family protein
MATNHKTTPVSPWRSQGATTGRDLRPHTSLIGIAMVLRMPELPRAATLWPVLALALYGVVQPALAPLRQEPTRYAAMTKPDYPPEALLAGIEGKTVLRVLISASGTASRVEVHQSSAHPSLDAAALQSVQQFQFIPARTNGVAHASWARIPIGFSIESRMALLCPSTWLPWCRAEGAMAPR